MWLRVQRAKKREAPEEEHGPEQVVLSTPDGNFTVFEKCEPASKRWCSLSRIHSDHYQGDMIVPVDSSSTSDQQQQQTDTDMEYDFYKKCDDKEYGFEDDIELFRITPLLMDDDYFSSQDSDDSNAEHYYTNDYPEDYWSD